MKHTMRIALQVSAILVVVILALALVAVVKAQDMNWICQPDTGCHVLMHPGSDLYILMMPGCDPELIENGADSWQISCGNSRSYLPTVGR